MVPVEARGVLGTRVTDSCEAPCMCWELKPGPLGKKPLLLVDTEPSLQLLVLFLFMKCQRVQSFLFKF